MLMEVTETERDEILSQRALVEGSKTHISRANIARGRWERDAAAGLPVFPGGRTAAEWAPIAEESFRRAAHLPED